jgi:hypothetical protein
VNSPVSRTLELLRLEGYEPAIVERSIPTRPKPTKIDLHGIADVEAWADDHTLYVQVCRDEDLAEHRAKAWVATFWRAKGDPRPARDVLAGLLADPSRRFEIWAWALRGSRRGRKTWSERRWRAIACEDGIAFVESESAEEVA